MRRRYTHYKFCYLMVISLSSSFYSHSALGEWTPVITEKYNRKNIWRSIFHVLVRVLRKEIGWGQYVSTFSRWSLWVIDFVFIGICVEVVSCRAPVILLRSNARGRRRQHSQSIMPSVDPSLLCENKAIFLCKKLMVTMETDCWGVFWREAKCMNSRLKLGLLWTRY